MSNDNIIKMSELRGRQDDALRALLAEKQVEERKALFKQALGQLQKTHVLRQLRRDIARVSTELTRRTKEQEVTTP